MKLSGKFFLAFLSLSLLSYGISGAAYASVEPLSVTTNKEFYVDGATITISGFVKDFDTSDPMRSVDVTIMILAPNGNLVSVAQVTPGSDGNYSTTVIAAGMIKYPFVSYLLFGLLRFVRFYLYALAIFSLV